MKTINKPLFLQLESLSFDEQMRVKKNTLIKKKACLLFFFWKKCFFTCFAEFVVKEFKGIFIYLFFINSPTLNNLLLFFFTSRTKINFMFLELCHQSFICIYNVRGVCIKIQTKCQRTCKKIQKKKKHILHHTITFSDIVSDICAVTSA